MTRVAFTRAERDAVARYRSHRGHSGVVTWDPEINSLLAKMNRALAGHERRVRAARRKRSAERKRDKEIAARLKKARAAERNRKRTSLYAGWTDY